MSNSRFDNTQENPLYTVSPRLAFPFFGSLSAPAPQELIPLDPFDEDSFDGSWHHESDFRSLKPAEFELDGEDQEKLNILRESDAPWALGYNGRWMRITETDTENVSVSLHMILKDRATSAISLGATPVKLSHFLPEAWEGSEWFSAHIVNTLQQATISLTVWDCHKREWKAINSVSEIKNSTIRGSATALLDMIFACNTSGKTLDAGDFKLSPSRGVVTFCLGETELARTYAINSAVVPKIDAATFSSQVADAHAFADQLVRPKIEEGIADLANRAILSRPVQSFAAVVDAIADQYRDDHRILFELLARPRPTWTFEPSARTVISKLCSMQELSAPFALATLAGLPIVEKAENKPHFYQSKIPVEDAMRLRDRYLREGPKAFEGAFWNEYQPEFQSGARLPREIGSVPVLWVHSLPHDSVIENIIAFRPEAEPLMRRWREIWDRSFPNWQNHEPWTTDKVEKSQEEYWKEWATDALNEKNYKWQPIDKLHVMDNAIHADKADLRDYRLHVIDDADKVLNMTQLDDGMGILKVMDEPVIYVGRHSDGMARFEFAKHVSKYRINKPLHETPRYWNWPFFLKHLGRKGAVAPSKGAAGAILFDMSLQGHSHAFLKLAKGKGTWTIPLTGINTLTDAENRLLALLLKDRSNENPNLIIQEHVPFTHEQRFYINNGRVFASACSDRHFCVLDASGKRLDHRLAVLTRPSIDSGYFDRGITRHISDRKTSALFARKARRIARELKAHGILEYSLDIGLTERGPVCIEINTLHNAGPYNLRRELYMRAYKAKTTQMRSSLYAAVATLIEDLIEDKDLKRWSHDLLDRNRERLPEIFLAQFDALPPSTEPDNSTNLAALVAQSFVLTAMLEQPANVSTVIEVAA
ncbi:hypothetical protein [Rhizobium sp. MHM7A]|uniref:hypothetical protein n=1 Tax=Rhizobium sp. MHM7A TaxID=2583233 RepID=UPI001105DBFF|nr:hypothetical protein [Rhizobium sp. MHM7A]TLX15916.1 hypothetical protein FFR93_00960 [Rhizobium sp. MHM7A]